jgi:hypothetical protein
VHIDQDLVSRVTPAEPIPKPLRPIFRDRQYFDAGASLREQTRVALDESAALVLLASPHAARSNYVNEEVRLFKSRHPDRAVIPLVVEGDPDGLEKNCFPPALRPDSPEWKQELARLHQQLAVFKSRHPRRPDS